MGSVSLCVSAKALKNPKWQFQPFFAIPPSAFPELSHQDEKRPPTHFQLLMCDIRKYRSTLVGRESGGEVERSGCERVALTMRAMMAIGDGGDALL